MKLTSQRSTIRQIKADAVALFISEDKEAFRRDVDTLRTIFKKKIDTIIELGQFKGKNKQFLSLFTDGAIASPRLFLIGLGEGKKLTIEHFRRAAATAAKQATSAHAQTLALVIPAINSALTIAESDVAYAFAEGTYLSEYKFDKYFTEKKNHKEKLKETIIISSTDGSEKAIKKCLQEARIVCESVKLARDLANAPGNEIYPETLADAVRASGQSYGYRVTVWDKQRLEQAKFGGLLGVSAGSAKPPRFIILEHNGGQKNLDTIVLVGKGVTFDAGGISIKPASGMSEMKMDMSGAAAVIGTLEAASRLKLPVHLVGLVPATENLLGGSAMKPGDIITHYGGKTSEVDNTDAEGRLILADALAYASTYKPKAVIDLATLTGACVVALGQHATGMMGNDDGLMSGLKVAGEKTYERVWQLPLFEEYEKQIKSDVADVKNVGGRWAGAITAALFLKKFIGDYKWVHLDIAGPAILEENLPYAPRGASGVGVRLLIEFLKHRETGK